MQSITDGDTEIAYTYNGDGLRTSKTVNGETTNYYYNGSILAGQKSGDDTLVFMYDNNSDIFGFIYNDTEYYYIKNAQNDVIAIADANSNILVKYTYDAWGKVIAVTDKNGNDVNNLKSEKIDPTTGETITEYDENGNVIEHIHPSTRLSNLNPILYRSYYYDKETEWYYLNTRYYSPDMCRFINADGYVQTGQGMLDKNMFAYCGNNPIKRADLGGTCWFDYNGNWHHDNWEYIGDYNRRESPLIEIRDTPSGRVFICKPGTSVSAPPGCIIVYDKRQEAPKKRFSSKKAKTNPDNNFEVQNSCFITNEIQQTYICIAIIEYNNDNPGNYDWNRSIASMLVEWDWHNEYYNKDKYISSSQSVNFDMGLGANHTEKFVQKGGYICEKIRKFLNL